jgi:hypothetical protein
VSIFVGHVNVSIGDGESNFKPELGEGMMMVF